MLKVCASLGASHVLSWCKWSYSSIQSIVWHLLVHTLCFSSWSCLFLTQKYAICKSWHFTVKVFFQGLGEYSKHLQFFGVILIPLTLIVSHSKSKNCWFCLSLCEEVPQICLPQTPALLSFSMVYCQGLYPSLLKRAVELLEQASVQPCFQRHLERSIQVCFHRLFNYIFLGIKLRLTDLKLFKVVAWPTSDVSLLKQ